MRVLLVTTWDQACGIAEHSFYLKYAVEQADGTIEVQPCPAYLDPNALFADAGDPVHDEEAPSMPPAIVHLNYHGALHSRWTAETIAEVKRRYQIPVVVTYHDTGVPNSEHCKAVVAAADAAVIHEPADDLDEVHAPHYWRMGVPDWPMPRSWWFDSTRFRRSEHQPVLGSIGFPFPWKNFDLLAKITAELGWALVLIAPTASEEWVRGIRAINPASLILTTFVQRDEALSLLGACDATAFPYVCHNTGQSGAILQGVGARKPVHAFSTCRQFRSLFADPLGRTAITWADDVEQLRFNLSHFTRIERVHAPMVALAEQESWARLGQKYSTLYKELV